MHTFTRKSLYPSLAFVSLTLSLLACGGASTPATSAPVENTAAPAATATQEAASQPAGESPANPAPKAELISTANWEFNVVEVHRGEDALALLKAASPFNKENPDPAMEYVLVKVHAKYTGTDADTHHIDGNFFRGMDSAQVLYDKVSNIDVKAPAPSMSSFDDLASGGEVEGWAVIQVKKDDPAIMLVILPRENGLQLGEETVRYISLE